MQYSRDAWTLSASAATNHFDSADCSHSVISGSVAKAVTRRLSPADLSALSARFANQGRLRAGGAIGHSLALLRSQYPVGIEHIGDHMTVAADASRATSEFGSSTQDTYEVSGTLPVQRRIAVKVAAGTTITASVGAPYVGVYVLIDW